MLRAVVDTPLDLCPELAGHEVHGDAGPVGLVVLRELDALFVRGLPVSGLRVGDANLSVRIRIRMVGKIVLQIVRVGLDPVPLLDATAVFVAFGPVLAAQRAGVLVRWNFATRRARPVVWKPLASYQSFDCCCASLVGYARLLAR